MTLGRLIVIATVVASVAAAAADAPGSARRTNGQNFKDRALANCVAQAYKDSPAAQDAAISTSAFVEWTYYDEEKADPAVDALTQSFLKKDYGNPLEGYAGAKFDMLKCLDLYHSAELEVLVRKHVPHPNWVGDHPQPGKRK